MAKSKKAETSPKKKADKSPAPAGAVPGVDTSFAAQAAAKQLVASRAVGGAVATNTRETMAFKNLKDSLAHPASTTVANLLDKSAGPGQRKSNLPSYGGKQVGRNQTFGADVNRTGVPRRTGGG